jgi:hypothetical protein
MLLEARRVQTCGSRAPITDFVLFFFVLVAAPHVGVKCYLRPAGLRPAGPGPPSSPPRGSLDGPDKADLAEVDWRPCAAETAGKQGCLSLCSRGGVGRLLRVLGRLGRADSDDWCPVCDDGAWSRAATTAPGPPPSSSPGESWKSLKYSALVGIMSQVHRGLFETRYSS